MTEFFLNASSCVHSAFSLPRVINTLSVSRGSPTARRISAQRAAVARRRAEDYLRRAVVESVPACGAAGREEELESIGFMPPLRGSNVVLSYPPLTGWA